MKFTKDELKVIKLFIIYHSFIFDSRLDIVTFRDRFFGLSFRQTRRIINNIVVKLEKDSIKRNKIKNDL